MLQLDEMERTAGMYAAGMLEASQLMMVANLSNQGMDSEAATELTNACVTRFSPKSFAFFLTTRKHDDDDLVAHVAVTAFIDCVANARQ